MISQLRKLRKQKRNARPACSNIDVAVLDDRVLFSANPLAMAIETAEDAPAFDIDLHDIFSIDDGNSGTMFEIQPDSDHQHFESLTITDGVLHVELKDNVNGVADISVLASIGQLSQELDLHFDIESVNDSPVFNGFTSVETINGVTTIDLFAAFDDVEDADAALTFEIASSTNVEAFESITLNQETGTLVLHHGDNSAGYAEFTITATDSGGLSTGLGTPDGFQVYEILQIIPGEYERSLSDLGLTKLQFWTSWYFFDRIDGQYDMSTLDVEGFVSKLENHASSTSKVMFDIENDFYVNTVEGRDRFAEVLYLANEVRPDLDIGIYRILPERQWFPAVNWARAQADAALGLTTSYSSRYEQYQDAYEDWLGRNERYRTEPVSDEFGGTPVADLVDTIYPSLYTFYYENVGAVSAHYAVEIDATNDTLSVADADFSSADRITLRVADGGFLRNGLLQLRSYYVVNRDGDSFQISETPGGEAIDFTDELSGNLFAQAHDFTNRFELDRNVKDWVKYAEFNIAEARKYEGKDVVPWLSPSIAGVGAEYLSGDFFRMQLETVRSLADSLALYDFPDTPGTHVNEGWYTALGDFMESLDDEAATLRVEFNAEDVAPSDPVPQNDVFSVREDATLFINPSQIVANDIRAEGATIQIVATTQHGALIQDNAGQIVYRPAENYHGLDAFTYLLNSDDGSSQTATVFINVNSVNDSPEAVSDRFATANDRPLAITHSQLLANDFDADGDRLYVQILNGPSNGVLSHGGNGLITYEANNGFNGIDQIEYRVFDGESYSDSATIEIDVFSTRVANADVLHVPQDTVFTVTRDMLLENDVITADDHVAIQIVTKPKFGRVLWANDGRSFTYTPNPGFNGVDEILYRLADSDSASNTATLSIHVDPIVETPVATSDAFGVAQGRGLNISLQDLLSNDRGLANENPIVEIVQQPNNGFAEITQDGRLSYNPGSDFLGVDQLYYRVSNGHHWSNPAAINLLVFPEVDAVSTEGIEVSARSEIRDGGRELSMSRPELNLHELAGFDPLHDGRSVSTGPDEFSNEADEIILTEIPSDQIHPIELTRSDWASKLAKKMGAFVP